MATDSPSASLFRTRTGRLLAIAAWSAAFLFQLVAIDRQSLIGDAPYHLLAAEQALRYGQNRINLEHPPLVKLLAGLPLLLEAPLAPPTGVRGSLETSANVFDDPARLDRVRHRSRWILLVVFAVPLIAVCYRLGCVVAGPAAGVTLSLFVALSLSALPFLSVIQTDTAASLGFGLTLLAAIGYARRPQIRRAMLLGVALGVAVASKFSGVLLLPTVLVTLALASRRDLRHRLLDGVVVALTAVAVVYVTYAAANRAYDAEVGRETIRAYCRGEAMVVGDRMQRHEGWLLAVERLSPEVAQWLTGFVGIRLQNEIGIYPSYAFGRVDSRGRWWYFPAVLLVKTPIILLLATVFAVIASVAGRPRNQPESGSEDRHAAWVLIVVTVIVYLGSAMASSYNLGVRHLLPILPLLYLPAAIWAASNAARAVAVVALLFVEAVAVAPLWMSVTNTWWLGEANPTRFALSDSNNEYMQNFVVLAAEARSHRLEPFYVMYPPLPERQIRAYAPQARLVSPDMPLTSGWYAVNVRVEQFLPALLHGSPQAIHDYEGLQALAQRWYPLWRAIAAGEDHGYVAGTFHLYRLDVPTPKRSSN